MEHTQEGPLCQQFGNILVFWVSAHHTFQPWPILADYILCHELVWWQLQLQTQRVCIHLPSLHVQTLQHNVMSTTRHDSASLVQMLVFFAEGSGPLQRGSSACARLLKTYNCFPSNNKAQFCFLLKKELHNDQL